MISTLIRVNLKIKEATNTEVFSKHMSSNFGGKNLIFCCLDLLKGGE